MRLRPGPFLLVWLASLPASALSGVCPDGSIFIVQHASSIPCAQAKRVEPSDVPPIQPANLPRPYGWERFNRRSDPNNPYNIVETPTRATEAAAPPPAPEPTPGRALAAGAPPPLTAAPAATSALALSPRELADLDELVALMQRVAPATLAELGPDGSRHAKLELARSSAFEQRVHAALAQRGGDARGPVVLFRAEAEVPQAFHGHLTFVQGHVAFHPDPADPGQFGVIDGALGDLAPGERVLGYAVLPAHLDPSQPLDIYWDDRRITATLR